MLSEDIILIGERLTELRIKQNMTQEEFAEYMCVTRQSVSKWETDKAYPDVEKLIKIAELYNVSLDYLVTGKDNFVQVDKISENNSKIEISDSIAEDIDNIDEVCLSKKSMLGLKICLVILGLFIIISLAVIIMFLVQNPWFHSDISETLAKVDKVYGQVSLAEVSYENDAGDELSEFVLLDIANVREGDYINTFINENGNLFIDYDAVIIIFVILFLVLNIVAVLFVVKELDKK